MRLIAESVTWTDIVVRDPQHRAPGRTQLATEPPLPTLRLALWAERNELLPQAWIAGFLDSYKTTMFGNSYLVGRINRTGSWYYFPLTMLFKTPLATLACGALAVGVALRAAVRRQR